MVRRDGGRLRVLVLPWSQYDQQAEVAAGLSAAWAVDGCDDPVQAVAATLESAARRDSLHTSCQVYPGVDVVYVSERISKKPTNQSVQPPVNPS